MVQGPIFFIKFFVPILCLCTITSMTITCSVRAIVRNGVETKICETVLATFTARQKWGISSGSIQINIIYIRLCSPCAFKRH
uniref:Putative secreted peptide n=1 Tax=Anopheles braziliensis TaxID=58242 RepID=A0A2M3ZW06_9DIPT